MVAPLDIEGRLAEGRPAVDDLQAYVAACQARGYQHPDLTLHSAQVRDWYGTEDGLDLRLLDGDCVQLQAAGRLVDDALRSARAQADALAVAWAGRGGDAAAEFVRRHCQAAAVVADEVHGTAEAMARLRDELWGIVDRKVAATVSIDDRSRLQRPGWLAAARTVSAGAGSATGADDVVDTELKPFVDNDIRGDWLTSMRTAIGTVTQAYRAAQEAIGARVGVRFEVPGDLGPPAGSPAAGTIPAAAPAPLPAAVLPAAAAAPLAAAPARPRPGSPLDDLWPGHLSDVGPVDDFTATQPNPAPPPAPTSVPPSLPPAPAVPSANPLDGWGSPGSVPALGGTPAESTGGGIAGLPGGLADLLGGLLGGSGDSSTDPLPPPDLDGGPIDNDAPDDPAQADEKADDSDENAAGPDDPVESGCQQTGDSGPSPTEEQVAAAPPPAAPPPEQPPPSAEADAKPAPGPVTPTEAAAPTETPVAGPLAAETPAAETPCEIAADELPQAGE
jgi:hypothetical protein